MQNGTRSTGKGKGGNGQGGAGSAKVDETIVETEETIAAAKDAARQAKRPVSETFVDERDDVLAVIHELEDQLDRYEEIRERLERELGETQEQARVAKSRVQELEWQTVSLQGRLDQQESMRQELTMIEEELADANKRAQRAAEQSGALEKENHRIGGELKNANKQLEELWSVRQERDGLRNDLKSLRARVDTQERAIRDITDERNTIQVKLSESQKALDDTRGARNRIEIELRNAADRCGEQQRIIEALEQKIETGKQEKKAVQAHLTHVERENTRIKEQNQFYECEIASLRSMNRSAESALSNVKNAFAEVRVALSETKARARRRTIEGFPRSSAGLKMAGQPSEAEVGVAD